MSSVAVNGGNVANDDPYWSGSDIMDGFSIQGSNGSFVPHDATNNVDLSEITLSKEFGTSISTIIDQRAVEQLATLIEKVNFMKFRHENKKIIIQKIGSEVKSKLAQAIQVGVDSMQGAFPSQDDIRAYTYSLQNIVATVENGIPHTDTPIVQNVVATVSAYQALDQSPIVGSISELSNITMLTPNVIGT